MIKFRFTRDASFYPTHGWLFELVLGRGAGYRWGRTFYIGRNLFPPTIRRAGISKPLRAFTVRAWQVGFTQNANAIPITRH